MVLFSRADDSAGMKKRCFCFFCRDGGKEGNDERPVLENGQQPEREILRDGIENLQLIFHSQFFEKRLSFLANGDILSNCL